MTPLDVFGGVMYLLFFAPFLFPLAPWFAKSPRGAWLVCCAAVSASAVTNSSHLTLN